MTNGRAFGANFLVPFGEERLRMRSLAFVLVLLLLDGVGRVHSASLTTEVVLPNQLGSGVANTSSCQNRMSTGASCDGGSPAGITYAMTAQNWSQSLTMALTAGSPASVTLPSCPQGIDYTSGAGYQVRISGDGRDEVVKVTSGSTSGSSCSIGFTPFYNHTSYTIGSASSGIQETINAACGTSSTYYLNAQCNVTIPANGPGNPHSINTYNIYGTIFLHSTQSVLNGAGTSLNCYGRGPCLQIGDGVNSNHYAKNAVQGLSFRSPTDYSANPSYSGVAITNTVISSNVAMITTATAHGFRPGDLVSIMFTDYSGYWGDAIVTNVPASTTFTYRSTIANVAVQTTPGVVALEYAAVLDTATGTHFTDITYDLAGNNGHFNNFFDLWDDENALIEHFDNNAIGLNQSGNWTGSFVYSGGAGGHGTGQDAAVIALRDSSITANGSNCVTDYNSNGLYIDNTVCQASGPWQVFSSNYKGNYQGATIKNLYSESAAYLNPYGTVAGTVRSGTFTLGEKVIQGTTGALAYLHNSPSGSNGMWIVPGNTKAPDNSHPWVGQTSGTVFAPTSLPAYRSPFPGTGIAGLIAGASSGAATFAVNGSGAPFGAFQAGGTGATPYTYYVVANRCPAATHCPSPSAHTRTSPMQVLNWNSTGHDLIPVTWPRIANGLDTITYDLIRMTTPIGITNPSLAYPYPGGCTGGSGGACGSVATGLAQCSGLVCTYTDTGSSTTAPYTINEGLYWGTMNFWPGALVAQTNTVRTDNEIGSVVGVGLGSNPLQVTAFCGGAYGVASPGGYTACSSSQTSFNNAVTNQTATLMTDGVNNGGGTGSVPKGRLNFGQSPWSTINAHHIVTLIDSQPGLTHATPGFRPEASANDIWIGTDVSGNQALSTGQLAFGAPVSITNYIRATGDGVHSDWLERLTSTQKTFKVPVRINQGNSFTLGDGSPLSQMKIYSANNMSASRVPPQSCVDLVGEAKGLTKSDHITSITPPGRLGNLSLNAYPTDEGAIILHFCNPSNSEVITPTGAYSFLAVR
jgi:hypothetical protein